MSIEAEKSSVKMPSSTDLKSPEVVLSSADIEAGSDDEVKEEIKRDLKGRHINMIALAGMIVSGPLTPDTNTMETFSNMATKGYRSVLVFWKVDCSSWPCGGFAWLHLHGPHHVWRFFHLRRDISVHAADWRFCSPCKSTCRPSSGSGSWMELL
jgi:hypothetical protein